MWFLNCHCKMKVFVTKSGERPKRNGFLHYWGTDRGLSTHIYSIFMPQSTEEGA